MFDIIIFKFEPEIIVNKVYVMRCFITYSVNVFTVHFSPSASKAMKSSMMRWMGHVACMEEKSNTYTVLVVNPEEKQPLGRPKSR